MNYYKYTLFIFTSLCFVLSSKAFANEESLFKLATQSILVVAEGGSKARVYLVQRNSTDRNSSWYRVRDFPAWIGKNGFADLGEKSEGDGRTPTGVFNVTQAFGYDENTENRFTEMPYRRITIKDKFVIDTSSGQYNTWIDIDTQAKSFRKMLRDDNSNKFGLIVDYNTDPVVVGLGSAIFINVIPEKANSTDGGIALKQTDMSDILAWLKPTSHPTISLNASPPP